MSAAGRIGAQSKRPSLLESQIREAVQQATAANPYQTRFPAGFVEPEAVQAGRLRRRVKEQGGKQVSLLIRGVTVPDLKSGNQDNLLLNGPESGAKVTGDVT